MSWKPGRRGRQRLPSQSRAFRAPAARRRPPVPAFSAVTPGAAGRRRGSRCQARIKGKENIGVKGSTSSECTRLSSALRPEVMCGPCELRPTACGPRWVFQCEKCHLHLLTPPWQLLPLCLLSLLLLHRLENARRHQNVGSK